MSWVIFYEIFHLHDLSSFGIPHPVASCETCQYLELPLDGLRAQSTADPVVGLLLIAPGQEFFPPFLIMQLYRCYSVVIASVVGTKMPREGEGDCWVG
jgi:hypothetical protein